MAKPRNLFAIAKMCEIHLKEKEILIKWPALLHKISLLTFNKIFSSNMQEIFRVIYKNI